MIDLDALLKRALHARNEQLEMGMRPAQVLDLIHLARAAADSLPKIKEGAAPADKPLPPELVPHLRQYQHNDCSGLLFGFDFDGICREFARLAAPASQAAAQQVMPDAIRMLHCEVPFKFGLQKSAYIAGFHACRVAVAALAGAAPVEAAKIPAGWKLVPEVPTEAMVRAACDAMGITQAVRRAIAAAPAPEAQ